MERCPSCRARLHENTLCPRCGCDLELALLAESQAQDQARRAIRALTSGNTILAARFLERSLTLRRGPLAEALTALLAARQASSAARLRNEISERALERP